MFKTRLISGIVLVIIALATIISGSWILFFTLLAVSLIGMRELYKVMKVSDEHVTVLELVGYLGAVLYYIAMKFDFGSYGTMAIIIGMILILFVYVFGYPKYRAEQVMAAFFGVVYVAVMLSFIYLTRSLPDGKFLVWLIFLCSWGCDDHTVKTVQDSSMARDQLTIVLDVLISLDGRCCQITYHGDQRSNCTDQGILCHFSLCGRCIDHSKKCRSHNAAYSSLDGFLRA